MPHVTVRFTHEGGDVSEHVLRYQSGTHLVMARSSDLAGLPVGTVLDHFTVIVVSEMRPTSPSGAARRSVTTRVESGRVRISMSKDTGKAVVVQVERIDQAGAGDP